MGRWPFDDMVKKIAGKHMLCAGPSPTWRIHKNNRAENSLLPIRRREAGQRGLAARAAVHKVFNIQPAPRKGLCALAELSCQSSTVGHAPSSPPV
jgi:hypothetical protein